MPTELAERLLQTLERELPHLRALTDQQASVKPPGDAAWSPKQELGHLIDSAANNHVRFVRAAISPTYVPLRFDSYAQDAWVAIHAYHDMSWIAIIDFWELNNRFIVSLIARIPADRLSMSCLTGSDPPATLGFLIADYIVHMQHHLDHLLHRALITPYPQLPVKPD